MHRFDKLRVYQVLAAKCDTTTCTTLTSDMTIAKACLTNPSASGCSTTYSAASTLPGIVTNVDKCMTSVSDSTCTASYGASANLITSGGSGMVGYIQQLSRTHIHMPVSQHNMVIQINLPSCPASWWQMWRTMPPPPPVAALLSWVTTRP